MKIVTSHFSRIRSLRSVFQGDTLVNTMYLLARTRLISAEAGFMKDSKQAVINGHVGTVSINTVPRRQIPGKQPVAG
jgi:hypothetical protein